jgi:hypothetical protein
VEKVPQPKTTDEVVEGDMRIGSNAAGVLVRAVQERPLVRAREMNDARAKL